MNSFELLQSVVESVSNNVKNGVAAVVEMDHKLDKDFGPGNKGDRAMFEAYVDSISEGASALRKDMAKGPLASNVVINSENIRIAKTLPGVEGAANDVGAAVGDMVSDILLSYVGRNTRRLRAAIAMRRASKIYLVTMINQIKAATDAQSIVMINGEDVPGMDL